MTEGVGGRIRLRAPPRRRGSFFVALLQLLGVFLLFLVSTLVYALVRRQQDAGLFGLVVIGPLLMLLMLAMIDVNWGLPFQRLLLYRPIAIVIIAGLAVVVARRYARQVLELRASHAASRRFVPGDFLKLLGREEVLDVERGDATMRRMTVMFADVRGFSGRSEKHTPEENFRWLNRYLEVVEPAIREHAGFVNQYFGDGILALFPDADGAVRAARAMLVAVASATEELGAGGEPLRIGIGLHTGPLMLGTIGGDERLDTGVVGDAVNTAARIEGLTKTYDLPLLVSAATKAACDDNTAFIEVDRVTLRGRTEETTLFTVDPT